MKKRILLASPRGFCAGVERGIKILEDTIREKSPVYVLNEIVHNVFLLSHFKSKGVVFVDALDEVPPGSTVVFSTHGVAPSVRKKAEGRNLKVIDATCPLVTKVHEQAIQFKNQGYTIILIGMPNHPEIIGTAAEAPDNTMVIQDERDFDKLDEIDGSQVAWLSQTTLNVDVTNRIVERLREKFPQLQDPPQSCICYATKNRQHAVKNIAHECDLFIAVGSKNSSNTVRLAEVADDAGATQVLRIDNPEELNGVDFSSIKTIGITSGSSVANEQLMRIIAHLDEIGYDSVEER